MMVWIMGPENEEVRVLFSMAEGALTLKKKNQVAVWIRTRNQCQENGIVEDK